MIFRNNLAFIRVLTLTGLISVGCYGAQRSSELDVSPSAGIMAGADAFLKYYQPVAEGFTVKMPEYNLPIDITKAINYDKVAAIYLQESQHRQMLSKNGFVVFSAGAVDDISVPYKTIREQDIPIYVTADTPLHLFHIQFDETLKEIEENYFYSDILAITKALLAASEQTYKGFSGDLKEAARRNIAYFVVALKQFDPSFKPPASVSNWVVWECQKIEEHAGLPNEDVAREKSLFKLPEDYSQYKPRGHYTRSDTLKKYFRGMMWYGRMTFLLKGHEMFGPVIPPDSALVDRKTARIQTLQAALIAAHCGSVKMGDGRTVAEVWNRIYAVTAFYAGFADDLTIYDYREALKSVFGNKFTAKQLENEPRFAQFLFELARLKPPAIFSGTGAAAVDPGGSSGHQFTSIKQLDNILTHTMGLRFMGQRYIPDSYILGQLVSPGAGSIPRKIPSRFTVVHISDERIQPDLCYSIRGFPMGLDVFSVLGSMRAKKHIADAKDDEYPKYQEQVEKLRKEFEKITPEQWNQNLYWSWLYALKALTEERGKGYQKYQQTDAWLDRQLNTALASWSALRHNTILYAKQSYTPVFIGITSVQPPPPQPPPPKGLVEPLPSFYARILATAKMTQGGLKELGVLSETADARLTSLVSTLEHLYDICKRQVVNEPLTDADNNFLANFPEAVKNAIGDVDEKGLKTTIIADVHTEMNSKLCLEEASGYLDYIVIAYKRPAGDIVLAVGPSLSYYEFKHPIDDRLTDEKWQEILTSGSAPARPDWIESFYSHK